MGNKSRQSKAEEEKTVSLKVTGLRQLRFNVLEPANGVIEISNSLDNGRVCSLRLDDFNSMGDAQAYAEIIRIAPELLGHYLGDAKKLKEVVTRMEKELSKGKRIKSEKRRENK